MYVNYSQKMFVHVLDLKKREEGGFSRQGLERHKRTGGKSSLHVMPPNKHLPTYKLGKKCKNLISEKDSKKVSIWLTVRHEACQLLYFRYVLTAAHQEHYVSQNIYSLQKTFLPIQFREFSRLKANKYCHKKLGNHLGSDINYRRQLGALLQTFASQSNNEER